jgi:cytochrome c556
MSKLSTIALALVFAAGAAGIAFADDKPTDDEAAKIKAAVEQFGCSGGTYEKESEGTGVYEAEDVKCKAGQYDFRLDKDYKVFAITVD